MKPIERDQRSGRSRSRTASTDRASRPIDLPQQMVGWDMVFQAEVLSNTGATCGGGGLRRCA
jgi:hypothetical protein